MSTAENMMVVDCAGYEKGHRACSLPIADVREWISDHDRFVWIGLCEPSAELLRQVQAQFGLHDLAVEDALHAHQRPKLEFYGDSLFLVLHTAQFVDGHIAMGETYIFAGRGYLVAVRKGPSLPYGDVRARCEALPAMLHKGSDFVLYALMDFIVDRYMPLIIEMEDKAQDIERQILEHLADRAMVTRVYELKRELLTLHSSVAPLVDICNRLVRYDSALIDEDMRPYFRDIHDHAMRLDESIDYVREMLSSALEANLMLASFQQNEVMKRLASYAAMLAVPTAIAGVYGMNFEFMPELHWSYGYEFALTIMIAGCGYLYYRFKKSGWL
ncbi:MAG TPA: magnesium/cobalt transporter CorA [Pseudomonadales bacterium]|nr:magnesium/cobalt transporter CorA [Pseudomonadales bacterium]